MGDLLVFEAADGIREICKFCAALAIVPKQIERIPQLLNAGLDNGTLTFIEHAGNYFGVTCKHVVDSMRSRNAKCGADEYLLATLKDGTYSISDEFHIPTSQAGSHIGLDIAITQLPREFPEQLGKRFFALTDMSNYCPAPLQYGIAVGFPTGDKTQQFGEDGGYKISMPCVHATAEAMGSGRQFLSILATTPATGHLSGISGGPVFWSTAEHLGLIGFVYEGDQTGPAEDMIQQPRVRFFVEPCDYFEFCRWTEELRNARAGRVATIRGIGH